MTDNNDATIYAIGICYCSVCAPADMVVEEVERAVNRQRPSGVTMRWSLDDAGEFKNGEPNPCECNHDSERMHYLLSC